MQYVHPVKIISYVTLDHNESKIFGYVCSQPNCPTGYQFYALKAEENVRAGAKKFALLTNLTGTACGRHCGLMLWSGIET